MLKRLRPLLILMVFLPSIANALELGEITARSRTGEVLNLELELKGIDANNTSDVIASFATREEFLSARIAYPGNASIFTFDVQFINGEYRLIIGSTSPFLDSHLRILLSLEVGIDRVIREYVVLLNPAISPAISEETIKTSEVNSRLADTGEPLNLSEKETSFVARDGHSLSSIVRQLGLPDSISVYQSISAIVKANPDAFFDNNMNRLIIGKTLTIPSWKAISQVDPTFALNDFNAQEQRYAQWLKTGSSLSNVASDPKEDQISLDVIADPEIADPEIVDAAEDVVIEIDLLAPESTLDAGVGEVDDGTQQAATTIELRSQVSEEPNELEGATADLVMEDIDESQEIAENEVELVPEEGEAESTEISADAEPDQIQVSDLDENEEEIIAGQDVSVVLTVGEALTEVDSSATQIDATPQVIQEDMDYGPIEAPQTPMLLDSTSELSIGVVALEGSQVGNTVLQDESEIKSGSDNSVQFGEDSVIVGVNQGSTIQKDGLIQIATLQESEVQQYDIDEKTEDEKTEKEESFETAFTILGKDDQNENEQAVSPEPQSVEIDAIDRGQPITPNIEGQGLKVKEVFGIGYDVIYGYVSKVFFVMIAIIALLLGYRFLQSIRKRKSLEAVTATQLAFKEDSETTDELESSGPLSPLPVSQKSIDKPKEHNVPDEEYHRAFGVMEGSTSESEKEKDISQDVVESKTVDDYSSQDDQSEKASESDHAQSVTTDELHTSSVPQAANQRLETQGLIDGEKPNITESLFDDDSDISMPEPENVGGTVSTVSEPLDDTAIHGIGHPSSLMKRQEDILDSTVPDVERSTESGSNREDGHSGSPPPITFDDPNDEDVDLQDPETALDLARAYLKLGEKSVAKGFVNEVIANGSESQKTLAHLLLKELTESEK